MNVKMRSHGLTGVGLAPVAVLAGHNLIFADLKWQAASGLNVIFGVENFFDSGYTDRPTSINRVLGNVLPTGMHLWDRGAIRSAGCSKTGK